MRELLIICILLGFITLWVSSSLEKEQFTQNDMESNVFPEDYTNRQSVATNKREVYNVNIDNDIHKHHNEYRIMSHLDFNDPQYYQDTISMKGI